MKILGMSTSGQRLLRLHRRKLAALVMSKKSLLRQVFTE